MEEEIEGDEDQESDMNEKVAINHIAAKRFESTDVEYYNLYIIYSLIII